MMYKEFITNILDTRGRFECGEEYHERHHITPRCMGGGNDEENLIDLFAREHFEAHRLLALENPENSSLIYAWWCMSTLKSENTSERYEITAQEYEEARKCYASMCSKRYSGKGNPNYGNHKLSGENHPMYGKHLSEETKQKISTSKSGENHHFYGQHHSEETKRKIGDRNKGKIVSAETRRKISEAAKNRPPVSEETCKKLSEASKGENNPNYGKHPSEETCAKISEARKGKCVGLNNCRARSVAQYDLDGNLIRVWDYIKQAAEELNINVSHMASCCRGEKGRKTVGGFVWRYADKTPQNDYETIKEREEVDRDIN